MVGFEGSFISIVTAVELGALATGPMAGMMPSSVSAVPLGGCDPPLGETGRTSWLAEGMLLLLDGCELRLDGTELRLDGTGCTPGRGGRELRDLAEGARPEPGLLSPPPPCGARSPRKR